MAEFGPHITPAGGGGTGGGSFSAGVSTGGNTLGDTGTVSNQIVFVGGNNVTLSEGTGAGGATVTISVPNFGGAQTGISSIGNSQTTYTSGAIQLLGSNMVTVKSTTGQGFVIDATQSVQPETQTFVGGLAASNTTYTSGTVTISGVGGGVTVSSNTGQRIDISVAAPVAQTNQSAIKALGASNTGNTAGNTGVSTGIDWVLAGSNNVTISQSTAVGGPNTLWVSGPTVGGAQTGISGIANSETTYTSGSVTFSGLGAITIRSTTGQQFQFSVNSQTTQSAIEGLGVSNTGNTLGNTGISTGVDWVLGASGGITASQSTAAGGVNTIWMSVANPVAQTNQAGSVFASNNTFGTSSGTYDARTISIAGDGIVSVAASNSGFRISASQSVQTQDVLSIGASNVGNTSGNTTVNTGSRFVLAGGNNITVSQGTAAGATTMTISAANQTTQSAIKGLGVSNTGNTAGNTGVSTGVDWVIAASTNITASQSTAVGGPNTIWLSAAAGGGAGLSAGMSTNGNTSGNTGLVTGQLALAGGNNITLSGSTNGGSMTITVSAPNLGAGAMSAGASNLGNTAGSTGITGTQLVMVGTGPISLSQSTGANGGTLSISAPATSSLSATGQVSISTNGSTISIGVPNAKTNDGHNPYADLEFIAGQAGQATLQFDPEEFPNFQFDRVQIPIHNTNSSNSSGSHTLSFWVGLWTKNVSTLSLWGSTSSSTALTHSGTAGSYSLYSGLRLFTIPWTTTVTEGNYWIGLISRTTSGGANGSYSQLLLSNLATNFLGHFGSSHNTTYQLTLGRGVYTATTSAIPSSVAFSQIRGSDSANYRSPIFGFASGTA